MLKFLLLNILLFALTTSQSQSTSTKQYVDSLVAQIERSDLFDEFTLVDSSNLSAQTQKVPIYTYKKQVGNGQIQRIEEVGSGTCDNTERYYFVNGKLIKVIVKLQCDDLMVWDSELYFDHDTVFAHLDKATELHGPAFIKSAYDALKRVAELEVGK